MSTIYVAGYPKSGNTWATRLLGEIIGCPTGGKDKSFDTQEIATEGIDRISNYVVRKGHFIPDSSDDAPVTAKKNWRLGYKNLGENKVILVVRDPRDIAVSGAHHWNVPVKNFLRNMITGTGGVRAFPPWDIYVADWITSKCPIFVLRYEDLHKDRYRNKLRRLFDEYLYIDVTAEQIDNAWLKQSFTVKKNDMKINGNNYVFGGDYNLWFMRKGISGDWKTHFTDTMLKDVIQKFGYIMELFGYK